jgi:hypothetical protein
LDVAEVRQEACFSRPSFDAEEDSFLFEETR